MSILYTKANEKNIITQIYIYHSQYNFISFAYIFKLIPDL